MTVTVTLPRRPSPPNVRLAGATQLAMASHGLHGLHGSTGALPRDDWSS